MMVATEPLPSEQILGVKFFTGSLQEACARAAAGGLVLAPSGPGLGDDLVREPAYRAALDAADLVLTDSGYLVLLWALRTGRNLPRHSGLAFLREFLAHEASRRRTFWVMPSEEEKRRNLQWLRGRGFAVDEDDCYVAPHYGPGWISDEQLVAAIERRRPEIVMLAIGGGVQERLGHSLRETLTYRPGIFCLGAAIAFLSGGQVDIPPWVDRWRLGWLWRLRSNPTRFAPRYVRALRLGWLVMRHGSSPPPTERGHGKS